MKNQIVDLIQSHRSIRRFLKKPIPVEVLEEVLVSAQWAPSSHNVQAYSIISVTVPKMKEEISKICKSQEWVIDCQVFLVFVADFYRLKKVSEMYNENFYNHEIENLLVGSIDVALAAQNTLIAARSYGLGGVIIGGIRRNPEKI